MNPLFRTDHDVRLGCETVLERLAKQPLAEPVQLQRIIKEATLVIKASPAVSSCMGLVLRNQWIVLVPMNTDPVNLLSDIIRAITRLYIYFLSDGWLTSIDKPEIQELITRHACEVESILPDSLRDQLLAISS
jgi:hypothetical protein